MKIKLAAIGKPKSKPVLELVSEYCGRVKKYCDFEISFEKSDESTIKNLSPSDHLVLFDERGKQFTSREMAKWFENHMNRSTKNIVFFIGGADGAGAEIKSKAKESISLSKMTLPHELALVMTVEQIYRAFSIIKKEPYHRD